MFACLWWPVSSGNKNRSSYCWCYFQYDYEICTMNIVRIGPRVLGGPLLLGSQYVTYCVLDWGYHGYWIGNLLCCTVGLVWLPGWYFNKMKDYKNEEWTEVAKVLRTDTSEIKSFMIDMKSVAVITEEFCILYCVIL